MSMTRFRLLPTMAFVTVTLIAALSAGGTVPASRPLTFFDRDGESSITVQLDPAARDAGVFSFRVPGRGAYRGILGDAMRRNSDHSTSIHYRGPAVLSPLLSLDGSSSGGEQRPMAVLIELQAQLDPAAHGGQATLREGGQAYHIVVSPRTSAGVSNTLRRFEDAVLRDDPAGVYVILTSEVRADLTSEAFVSMWRSQPVGQVTSLRRLSVADAQVNELGYMYVIATYRADRITPARSTESRTFEIFVIREGSDWKLLFSRAR
jgi:hypothetical protein